MPDLSKEEVILDHLKCCIRDMRSRRLQLRRESDLLLAKSDQLGEDITDLEKLLIEVEKA